MTKMLLPQEIEVWYVIPKLRAELAKLLHSFGMKQKEIACELGLTEAAVSQYLSGKRANESLFDNLIGKELSFSAKAIFNKKKSASIEIRRLLLIIKKKKLLCKLHEKHGITKKECSCCS